MASQTDPNVELNVNTGKPLEGIEDDKTGHEQDIQDEAVDQHDVDATLAENSFSAFSTASRWTYKTIEEHSLTSPLKILARNARRVKNASLHGQQTKSANSLSGQAEQLYRYLVNHKDIAAEIRIQGNGSAFDQGLAPWFVHLLDANENGVPPYHWQMGPSQYKEIIDLSIIGNGKADEPSEAIANPLVVQKSLRNADGRSEYFIINTSHDHLKVHGEEIEAYSIAGPLPDFSIIECDNKAIFFFRDIESLNHPNKASIVKKPTKSGKRKLAEIEPGEEEQTAKRLKTAREEAQKFSEGTASHVPKIQHPPKKPAPTASAAGGTDNTLPASHAEIHPAAQSDVDQSIPAAHNDSPALPAPSSNEVQPAQLAQPAHPSNLGPPPYLNWNAAYKAGLTRCKASSPKRASFADPTIEIPKATDQTYLEVALIDQAIASVWIALRPNEHNDPVNYSFIDCQASTNIQCQPMHFFISVDLSDTFIIPIILNSANKGSLNGEGLASSRPAPGKDDLPWNYQMAQHRPHTLKQAQGSADTTSKGSQAQATSANQKTPPAPSSEKTFPTKKKKVPPPLAFGESLKDHFVLAVAHRESSTGRVRMDYYNSGRTLCDPDILRAAARNIVRHSAWLKNDWPVFTGERTIRVRQQLLPTCGYHVIFNAWAVMLGIDVDLEDPGVDSEDDVDEMMEIVNLAIQGRIDADLITAFLHAFGFAKYEPIDQWRQRRRNPTSKTEETRYNMRSVLMTDDSCYEYIRLLRVERYNSEPDAAAETSHNGGDDRPDDEDAPDGNGGDGGDGGDGDDEDGAGGGDAGGCPDTGEDDFSDDLFSGWLPIDGPTTNQAGTGGEKSSGQKGLDTTAAATGNVEDGETVQSYSSGTPGVTAAAAGTQTIPGLSTQQHSHQAKGKHPAPSSALSKNAYIKKQREQVFADFRKTKDSETGSTSGKCAQITNLAALRGHDILMAITSLWRALLGHEQGTGPCSSRGTPIFSLPIGNEKRAVGSTRRLLFPLSFHTPGPDGSVGPRRYVLCLAIFDGEDEVLIEHYDSSITPASQATSQEEAEKYVKNAEWLSIHGQAERAWPRIRHSHLLVPQMLLPDSSGILVILNAWILLLRLRPRLGSSPNNGFQTSDRFLHQSRTLINHALAGRLHTSAIQAFLTSWGLTEDGNGSDVTRVRVTPVRTTRMNSAILAQIGGASDAAVSTTSPRDNDADTNLFYKIAIEAGALNASDAESSVRSRRSTESPPLPNKGKETPANISKPQSNPTNAGISTFHQAAIQAGDPFESIEEADQPMADPVAVQPPWEEEEEHERSILRVTPEYERQAQLCERFGDLEGAERWRMRKWKDEKYRRHDLEH